MILAVRMVGWVVYVVLKVFQVVETSCYSVQVDQIVGVTVLGMEMAVQALGMAGQVVEMVA